MRCTWGSSLTYVSRVSPGGNCAATPSRAVCRELEIYPNVWVGPSLFGFDILRPAAGTYLVGSASNGESTAGTAAQGALAQLSGIFHGTSDDQAEWFRRFDEGFIKPKLLLDQGSRGGSSGGAP